MNSAADNIFPFILDTLSQKPLLEESQKNLFRDLRHKIRNEGLQINNLKEEFEQALEIGQEIGVLRILDSNIRLPFYVGNKKQPSSKSRRKSIPPRRRRQRRQSHGLSRSRSGRRVSTRRKRIRRSSRK